MHCRASDLHAMSQRLSLRVEAGERREQRRMNVQDAKGVEKRPADATHESGETYQIDVMIAKDVDDRAVVGVTIGVVAGVQESRIDARLPRARQSHRLRLVRDDDGDGCVEAALVDGVDDRLEIAAAAGDQNGET